MDKLKLAEQALIKEHTPDFKAGDTLTVHYRVREGDKERIQKFEGVVISRRGSGPNETFICRKISAGNIGVERIFPIHSPFIAKIDVVREGDVRRSKLYYLRDLQGKAARVKEKDRRHLEGAAAKAKVDKAQKAEPKTEDQKEHKAPEEQAETKNQASETEASAQETEAKKPKATAEEE